MNQDRLQELLEEMQSNLRLCTLEEWNRQVEITNQYVPELITKRWQQIEISKDNPAYGAKAFIRHDGHLQVIFSAGNLWGDGKTWLHVSATYGGRLPTYDDLAEIKQIFIGDDRQAIQVFPAAAEHINIHPYCLHLWACIEGDGLPDFGREGTI